MPVGATKTNGHNAPALIPATLPRQGWTAKRNGAVVFIEGFENRWYLAREEARKRFSKLVGGAVSECSIELEWKE
jgi:hypothetical protein